MKSLLRIILLLFGLTGVGTAWFAGVEKWPLLDAVYMTVITLSTVGFREVHPLTPQSQIFVSLFLIAGIGVFMYGAIQLGEIVIRTELQAWWRKRSMNQEIKGMDNHFIICGCGRMGQMLCRHLSDVGEPFVTIERNPEALEICGQNGWLAIDGDATEDRTLIEAGVHKARGLAAVLSSDADNLYAVLSSKLLSKRLRVIARAYDERGVEKMQRAGADQVVSLYASGATKMAQLLINPKLGNFFEFVAEGGLTLDLAEITTTPDSEFAGKTLAASGFRQRGIIIVGIRRSGGEVIIPPSGTTVIETGDNLFALGDKNAITQLTSTTHPL